VNRRDFLKGMAMAGAASVAGGLHVPGLGTPPSACAASGRNKLVFISDIHMNVDGAYSWLVKHAVDLARFLTDLKQREDVAELIILGDLLDDWVCPVSYTPQTFLDVLSANHNNGVVPALQEICHNGEIDVTYVTGNHDMLSFEAENKNVISETFPGIHIISDAPGLGAYAKDNIIWAEHGHRYTLFNAPDIWSRAGGHLPMGYFISRFAASKSVEANQAYTTPEILDLFFSSPSQVQEYLTQAGDDDRVGGAIDDALIVAVFNAIALWAGKGPLSHFNMNGLDGFTTDPTVEEIAFMYDTIFSGWPSRQNIVNQYDALFNELGYLNSAANLLFKMPERIKDLYPFTPRIILFGHTHVPAFQFHSDDVETIYVNTGTWVDQKPDMTWAEVEIIDGSNGQRDYEVSLWFYGDTTPRHSGTISIQREESEYMPRHR
jgi:UDP-2,3-diacylglucosamine pyrophosphatase LpxH